MFFFLPLGHDRTVHGYPWATLTIMAACCLTFIVTSVMQADVEGKIDQQLAVVHDVTQRYPQARVHWDVDGLPEAYKEAVFDGLTAPERIVAAPGDEELDVEATRLLQLYNELPVLRFGYQPAKPRPITLLTNLFIHAGWLHLLGNMLFLFLAGSVIERFWGWWRFVPFYLLSGVGATLLYQLFNGGSYAPVVGASGAIAACLAAFAVGHPRARVRVLAVVFLVVWFWYDVVPVKAWVCVTAWVATQLVWAIAAPHAGVAYWAHLGGLGIGALGGLLAARFGWRTGDSDNALDEAHLQPALAAPAGRRRAAGARSAVGMLRRAREIAARQPQG
ncbi:MAG: rhomboid family intramembrane serine protease, partial [Myxococcales bacterium]|nr:rhomboid family intramembrane serine protease [Myxococcales bacterium]